MTTQTSPLNHPEVTLSIHLPIDKTRGGDLSLDCPRNHPGTIWGTEGGGREVVSAIVRVDGGV